MKKLFKKFIKKMFHRYFKIKVEEVQIYNFYESSPKEDYFENKSIMYNEIAGCINFLEFKFKGAIYEIAYWLFMKYWFTHICIISKPLQERFYILVDANISSIENEIISYLREHALISIFFTIHNSENFSLEELNFDIQEK
jgi:hypothetical protein